ISQSSPSRNQAKSRFIRARTRSNNMSLWVIRIFFLLLCTVSGYAVSQYRPEIIEGGKYGLLAGFGLGGLLVGIDHMVKGFSLRAFTAATFGLFLGTVIAWLLDRTQLFIYADERS